ncbi:MAG: reverse transcriptase family protein, partial [Alphaproteobacteria bacterium]|nr:reverse transcriptase family protein [Alphaproteobacteria bacterium]
MQLDEEERAPIAVEEVEVAISKLKNGKSPGICGISAEMLKAGRTVVVKWLHRIMSLAWENGQVPEDWRRAVIVPVHKKGSKVKCENYRGISLLSIPSKAYARILDERIRSVTESKVLEAQGGFRKGRSCTDQLFTIRQLSEKMIEKNKKMVVACVDLEKAYDRVGRDKLWKVLEEYGVKGRLLRAIRSLYKKSEGCVRVKDELSSWFPITQGVRQGCVMSPWLFNVFMDKIVREGMENFVGGVKMSTTEVGVVLFADDVMLLTERKEDMEANLRELKKAMSNWGMKIHWGKTKVMMVSRKGEECKVCVDGEEIEQVQNMKYLGAILSADGTCEEEIEQRVGAA